MSKISNGLFVCVGEGVSMRSSSWSNPAAAGAFLRISADSAWIGTGKYNWPVVLDPYLNLAAENKKSLQIAPIWNYVAPSFSYEESIPWVGEHNSGPGIPVPYNAPKPWDPFYIRQKQQFYTDMLAHINSNPEWAALDIQINAATENDMTEEERMPVNDYSNAHLDPVTSALNKWKAAKYTPAQVIAAFEQMTAFFVKTFKGRRLLLPLITNAAWPGLDDSSNPTSADLVTPQIIAYMKSQPNYMLMYTALTDQSNMNENSHGGNYYGFGAGVSTGYQLMQSKYSNSKNLNRTIVQNTFSGALANGVKMFQIFDNMLDDYSDILLTVANECNEK